MKNGIIAVLVALVAIGGSISLFAATRTVETTADVEVRVWQRVADGSLYLSTRPAGDTWTTHNTALDMSELSASGLFRQSSFVTVPVPVSVTVEVPDPPSGGATEPEPGSAPDPFGEWEYFEAENIAGNLAGYSLAGSDINGWRSGPLLYWRCNLDEGLGSLAVSVGRYVALPDGDTLTVRYRFSGGELVEETWWGDGGPISVVGVQLSTQFHRALRQATGKLFVSFTDESDEGFNFEFDVAGAAAVADWYRSACPNSVFAAP